MMVFTENTIRPQNTITIPWNLTLSGFVDNSVSGRVRIPEAKIKVTFTCPENGQLIVARYNYPPPLILQLLMAKCVLFRTSSFVLANVAVIGCNSLSDIILMEPRCADEREGNTRSHLVHVDFARNTLLQNGSLLNATQALNFTVFEL